MSKVRLERRRDEASVKGKLKRFALFARLRQEVFFLTIETGVGSYLETHPVDSLDWETAVVERRANRRTVAS